MDAQQDGGRSCAQADREDCRPVLSIAPDGPHGRDYRFEEKLGPLEQLFGLRGWAEISSGMVDLCDSSVRKGLALLTAVMFLRNPLRLAMTHDTHKSIVDFYSRLPELPEAVEIKGKTYGLDAASWPAYRDASEDDIKRMWLDQIGSAVWLAEMLMEMRWAMQFSETPVFITTDNPVVVVHPNLFRPPHSSRQRLRLSPRPTSSAAGPHL